jgi:dTDP-glucose 4,6-dehydratase
MLLITGGAGFIGSNLVHDYLEKNSEPIINVDKLTYAGNLQNIAQALQNPQHVFVKADIGDIQIISRLLAKHKPRAVINLAAESHVDRSIHDPDSFIQTNVLGTLRLLKAVSAYWSDLPEDQRTKFRFLQVSTDEVYGSLEASDQPFCETTPFAPNSPYAASKAGSDHLVRSFHHTYRLPVLTTNCSNNYGPYQFPEKLIPLVIHNALTDQKIPIYGDGQNIRDWLYVADHCTAIQSVLARGRPGETYNIGTSIEKANLEVVHLICDILDEVSPRGDGKSYKKQITFVKDRPGHDRRYAIDATKIRRELGWTPKETIETGLRKTVCWYLENQEWVTNVTTGAYRDWIALHYGERAGSA